MFSYNHSHSHCHFCHFVFLFFGLGIQESGFDCFSVWCAVVGIRNKDTSADVFIDIRRNGRGWSPHGRFSQEKQKKDHQAQQRKEACIRGIPRSQRVGSRQDSEEKEVNGTIGNDGYSLGL